MRVQVPLVIELDDGQVEAYADRYGLERHGGRVRAATITADVRALVLLTVQGMEAFDGGAAEVSIKR